MQVSPTAQLLRLLTSRRLLRKVVWIKRHSQLLTLRRSLAPRPKTTVTHSSRAVLTCSYSCLVLLVLHKCVAL